MAEVHVQAGLWIAELSVPMVGKERQSVIVAAHSYIEAHETVREWLDQPGNPLRNSQITEIPPGLGPVAPIKGWEPSDPPVIQIS
jgi:hypothetical protein